MTKIRLPKLEMISDSALLERRSPFGYESIVGQRRESYILEISRIRQEQRNRRLALIQSQSSYNTANL